jgi:hypothetical protein
MTYNKKTDQVTNIDAVPVVPLGPTEHSGRVRIAYFYSLPTAALAATNIVALCRLPAGARIIDGKLTSNAWVATSTADVGLAATDGTGKLDKAAAVSESAAFLTGGGTLAVATAGTYSFANTQANNYGYKTEKEVDVVMRLNTAGIDGVADVIQGHVLYVVD